MSSDDQPAVTAATKAVLHRYEHELYGTRNLDLVEELMSDPMPLGVAQTCLTS